MLRLAGALAVSAALLATAPTPARADFGPRFQVSGLRGESPQVAIGAGGRAAIAWREANRRIRARTRSAAGVLGPIVRLSAVDDLNISPPDVGVEADGDAVVVWSDGPADEYRVRARTVSAAGALGSIQSISAPGDFAPGRPLLIVMDADGDALIVWVGDGKLRARARSKTGVLGPIQTLSAASHNAGALQAAMDADGDAVVTWIRFDGADYRVQARARSKTGVLGPLLTLAPASPGTSLDPQVAIDADGDALIVWLGSDGTHDRVRARARSKAGVVGPVETLSEAGGDAGQPQVAMDADGDAMVVWWRASGADLEIQARKRPKAGGLGAVVTLSDDGFAPQVAVDRDGDAVFAWYRHDGSDNRVQARSRSKAGVLRPVETLSAAGQSGVDPQLAINADGDAVVTWRQFNGSFNRVWGAATP
jgi:hypothetical protein